MPAVSKAQFKYAAALAHGGSKGSASQKEWARELLNKSEGVSLSDLPAKKGSGYSKLSRRKRGIARYGK